MRAIPIQLIGKKQDWREQKEMLFHSGLDLAIDWNAPVLTDEDYLELLETLSSVSEQPSDPLELNTLSLSSLIQKCKAQVETAWSQRFLESFTVVAVTNEGYRKISDDAQWYKISVSPDLGEMMSNNYAPPVFLDLEKATVYIAEQNRRFVLGRKTTAQHYLWSTARLEVSLIDSFVYALVAQLRSEWKENRKTGLTGLTEESAEALEALTLALSQRTKEKVCAQESPAHGFYVIMDRLRDLDTKPKRRAYKLLRGLEAHLSYGEIALYDELTFVQKPDNKGRMHALLCYNQDLGSYASRRGS